MSWLHQFLKSFLQLSGIGNPIIRRSASQYIATGPFEARTGNYALFPCHSPGNTVKNPIGFKEPALAINPGTYQVVNLGLDRH